MEHYDLKVPWTEWRSFQSILKDISPEYSLEGLTLKLKLQYFSPPDAQSWLIRKDPYSGKDWTAGEGDKRGWDGWVASPTQWTWVWASWGDGDGQGSLALCSPWDRKESDTAEGLNWTEIFQKMSEMLFILLS